MGALYDSGLDENGPILTGRNNWTDTSLDKRIELGAVVAYKLPASDRPTNPNKVWRGLVKALYGSSVLVEMLEPGFLGLEERVQVVNIIGVE